MEPETKVAVIIGSTRPGRICPAIAKLTAEALTAQQNIRYELVDLAEVNLPLLNEPLPAALQEYKHDHTRAWSELISSFSGFVFVVPQYNWGYTAVVKNALDYLYFEWRDKPVTSVTYGTRGGNRAADQLREVFDGLHMRALAKRVELVITKADVDDDWQLNDVDAVMRPYQEDLRLVDAQMVEALQLSAEANPAAA